MPSPNDASSDHGVPPDDVARRLDADARLKHAAAPGNTPKCRIDRAFATIAAPSLHRARMPTVPCSVAGCAKRKSVPASPPTENRSNRCAPSSPSPSALRTTARPTGWSRPSISTCRSTRPRRGCARRCGSSPIRRPPAPAPLVLDGDGLKLVSLTLDGEALPADRYVADARPPHHRAAAAAAVPARDRDRDRSVRQHPADGALSLRHDLLHPVRGRRLPPHHLFPRPARRDGGLHHAHRGRQSRMRRCCSPTATSSRPATCRAPAGISRSGTIRSRSRPICSRWSAASSRCVEDTLPHHVGPRGGAAHLCRARQGGPLRLRHGFAQALDALGRGAVRPRIRSRHLHDRRGVRLQHGRDGEQGPQRLQRQIRAGQPGDRDRHRLHAASRRSSRTNISTTGPATASPAATGSSSA